MASQMVRLRPKTHSVLKSIASQTGATMQEVLDRAVDELNRRIYLEKLNADYVRLRKDLKASADFDRENALWDRTNSDGLKER
jgi:hypothetical protein